MNIKSKEEKSSSRTIIVPLVKEDLNGFPISKETTIIALSKSLFEVLKGEYEYIIFLDELINNSDRQYGEKWINDFLNQWVLNCKKILKQNDITNIFAYQIYNVLVELILNVQIVLCLLKNYQRAENVVIFVVENSFIHDILKDFTLQSKINWEIKFSNGSDFKSSFEKRGFKNFNKGKKTLFENRVIKNLKSLSFYKIIFRLVCSFIINLSKNIKILIRFNKRSVLFFGEIKKFSLLANLINELGFNVRSFQDIPQYFSFFKNKKKDKVLEKSKDFFSLLKLKLPLQKNMIYKDMDLSELINPLINQIVIKNEGQWLRIINFCERYISLYKPKLIITSTLDGPINAIAAYTAKSYGIKSLSIMDGYNIYSIGMPIKPDFSPINISNYLGYCCETQKNSFIVEKVCQNRLIKFPSPVVKKGTTFKNKSFGGFDLVIFTYFAVLCSPLQSVTAYEKYLFDCLTLAKEMKLNKILIKCKRKEEIKYVKVIQNLFFSNFELIELEYKPLSSYFLKAPIILGPLSTVMAECFKASGHYYIFEPYYGGQKAVHDDQFLSKNNVIATNYREAVLNIKSQNYFGSDKKQKNKYGLNFVLEENENYIWTKELNKII